MNTERERAPVVRERERDRLALRVVVVEREAAAERGAERRRGLRHVVAAAAVALEPQAGAADVEAVARQQQRAVVLDHRDVADVLAHRVGRRRGAIGGARRQRAAPQQLGDRPLVGGEAQGPLAEDVGRQRRRERLAVGLGLGERGDAGVLRGLRSGGVLGGGRDGGVSSPPPQATSETSSRTGPNRRSGMWESPDRQALVDSSRRSRRTSGNTFRNMDRHRSSGRARLTAAGARPRVNEPPFSSRTVVPPMPPAAALRPKPVRAARARAAAPRGDKRDAHPARGHPHLRPQRLLRRPGRRRRPHRRRRRGNRLPLLPQQGRPARLDLRAGDERGDRRRPRPRSPASPIRWSGCAASPTCTSIASSRDRDLAVVFQVELRQTTKFMERFSNTLLRDYLGILRERDRRGTGRRASSAPASARPWRRRCSSAPSTRWRPTGC